MKTALAILFALCVLGCGNMEEAEKSDENSSRPFPFIVLMSVDKTREEAEKGNADYQRILGEYLEGVLEPPYGEVVVTNFTEAAKWYRKAGDQGNMSAQYSLGLMLEKGKGVPKDDKEAAKWFRKAAELGHAKAQYTLGLMYREGKYPKEAIKWFQKAADQGNLNAQNNLGEMYENGEGVPKDNVQAYAWFNIAAANVQNSAVDLGGMQRENITAEMTPEQIAKAQELSTEMLKKNPKLLR
jgi:TPR repeat protein